MRVIFSPYLPQRQCYYLVGQVRPDSIQLERGTSMNLPEAHCSASHLCCVVQAGIRGVVPSTLKRSLPAASPHGQNGLSQQASEKHEQAAPATPDSSGAPVVTSCSAQAGGAQAERHFSSRIQRAGAVHVHAESSAASAASTSAPRSEEVVASGVFAL